MIQPAILQKGDTVCIVAPGRKLDSRTLTEAITIIKSWGIHVTLGQNLLSSKHSYLSGTDKERLDDLQIALNDNSVKAIICARGGYGTTRILDQLDFTSFIKNPKWICGFSDITALHLKLQSLNIQSIHSTMPVLFSEDELSVNSLRNNLFGNKEKLTADVHGLNKPGNSTGELIGGNLSLVVDSLGTASEIHTENRIMIVEEVGEYAYKIDRMIIQLKRAGKLKKLAGLVIGHMTDIKESELPFGEGFQKIISSHVKEYNYPVAFNFQTGHDSPNLSWIQGAKGQLEVTPERVVLKF